MPHLHDTVVNPLTDYEDYIDENWISRTVEREVSELSSHSKPTLPPDGNPWVIPTPFSHYS